MGLSGGDYPASGVNCKDEAAEMTISFAVLAAATLCGQVALVNDGSRETAK